MSKNAKFYLMLPVALGFFAFACFGSRGEKAGAQQSSTSSEQVALSSPPTADEVQLLRAQIAGLQAELHALQPTAAPPAAALPAPITATLTTRALDATPNAARRLPTAATLQAHYDAVFASESPDARWAPAEESKLVTFFGTDAAHGARLEKAECRASMCRLRVRFDDQAARVHFLAQIGSPPLDHGGFYRNDDATSAFTLYTARAGQKLPSLDPEPT